ncbi:MAG: hypothetical protein ABID09_04005, partial [Candidatus Omnitrophota bacterium]
RLPACQYISGRQASAHSNFTVPRKDEVSVRLPAYLQYAGWLRHVRILRCLAKTGEDELW